MGRTIPMDERIYWFAGVCFIYVAYACTLVFFSIRSMKLSAKAREEKLARKKAKKEAKKLEKARFASVQAEAQLSHS